MEFKVKLTVKAVFRFLMKKAYGGQYGRLSLFGGIILLVLAAVLQKGDSEMIYGVILIILGILLPCSTPFNIYRHAKMTVDDEQPEYYKLEQEQLVYSHLGHTMDIPWEKVGGVYEYANGLLIDLKMNRITLIPRECAAQEYEDIKNNLSKHIDISTAV